jgi:hypothetical protein
MDSVLTKIQDVKAVLGTPAPLLSPVSTSDEVNTIWETFTLLRNLILDPVKFDTIDAQLRDLLTKHSTLELKSQELSQGQLELYELCTLLGGEQASLFQLVQQHASSPAGSMTISTGVVDAFTLLEERVTQLEQTGMDPATVSLLKAQLRLIEARLPSDPFTIGGRTFNSKADVALFLERRKCPVFPSPFFMMRLPYWNPLQTARLARLM